jgi:hypothetical protein
MDQFVMKVISPVPASSDVPNKRWWKVLEKDWPYRSVRKGHHWDFFPTKIRSGYKEIPLSEEELSQFLLKSLKIAKENASEKGKWMIVISGIRPSFNVEIILPEKDESLPNIYKKYIQ